MGLFYSKTNNPLTPNPKNRCRSTKKPRGENNPVLYSLLEHYICHRQSVLIAFVINLFFSFFLLTVISCVFEQPYPHLQSPTESHVGVQKLSSLNRRARTSSSYQVHSQVAFLTKIASTIRMRHRTNRLELGIMYNLCTLKH